MIFFYDIGLNPGTYFEHMKQKFKSCYSAKPREFLSMYLEKENTL